MSDYEPIETPDESDIEETAPEIEGRAESVQAGEGDAVVLDDDVLADFLEGRIGGEVAAKSVESEKPMDVFGDSDEDEAATGTHIAEKPVSPPKSEAELGEMDEVEEGVEEAEDEDDDDTAAEAGQAIVQRLMAKAAETGGASEQGSEEADEAQEESEAESESQAEAEAEVETESETEAETDFQEPHPSASSQADEKEGRDSGQEGTPLRIGGSGGVPASAKPAVPHAAGTPPRPVAGSNNTSADSQPASTPVGPSPSLPFDEERQEETIADESGAEPGEVIPPPPPASATEEPMGLTRKPAPVKNKEPDAQGLARLPLGEVVGEPAAAKGEVHAPPPPPKQPQDDAVSRAYKEAETATPVFSAPSPEPPGAPRMGVAEETERASAGPSRDFVIRMIVLALAFVILLLGIGRIQGRITGAEERLNDRIQQLETRLEKMESQR